MKRENPFFFPIFAGLKSRNNAAATYYNSLNPFKNGEKKLSFFFFHFLIFSFPPSFPATLISPHHFLCVCVCSIISASLFNFHFHFLSTHQWIECGFDLMGSIEW